MPTYRVESNHGTDQAWVPCVREDWYMDNEDRTALETEAVFSTPEDAETFITAISDLTHMGAQRDWFRIVKEEG
jgi:hypothetical protein